MAQLRIGLAQVNSTVGDLPGNADLVSGWTRSALHAGCHLVVFPEMVLTGYPAEDLVLRSSFVQASLDGLVALAARLADEGAGGMAVVVGYCGRTEQPAPAVGRPAGEPQNSAAVLHRGKVVARTAKHHLPNYGVFDEFRYFVAGDRFPVVRLHGVDVGMAVCEDLWQEGGPVAVARAADVGLLVSPNASPVRAGQGRHPRRARCAAGPRGRLPAGLRQRRRRAGRAGVRRRLPRRGRRGRAGRPARRSGQERLMVVDLDLPRAR
jgi:NAD+ synthase (glutamine-hydrolysing)